MESSRDDAAADRLRARLRAALESLEDGDFLVLREPRVEPDPNRKGWLRRKRGEPVAPYVQFRCAEGWVYAECIGSTAFGGQWPITGEQHEAIRSLGWLAPGDEDPTQTQPPFPNYWRTVPAARVLELVDLGVGALRILGVDLDTVGSERGHV